MCSRRSRVHQVSSFAGCSRCLLIKVPGSSPNYSKEPREGHTSKRVSSASTLRFGITWSALLAQSPPFLSPVITQESVPYFEVPREREVTRFGGQRPSYVVRVPENRHWPIRNIPLDALAVIICAGSCSKDKITFYMWDASKIFSRRSPQSSQPMSQTTNPAGLETKLLRTSNPVGRDQWIRSARALTNPLYILWHLEDHLAQFVLEPVSDSLLPSFQNPCDYALAVAQASNQPIRIPDNYLLPW